MSFRSYIWSLRECNFHGTQFLFPPDREVGDHCKLLTAFIDIGLELVMRGPGCFRRDNLDRGPWLAETAVLSRGGQCLHHGGTVVIGLQVEIGDTQ